MSTKPADHPEFFRSISPNGSRESTIVLNRDGRFFADGDPIEHPALARALHTWIDIHPDDGRFILNNGTDWCYFEVEDAPFVVRRIQPNPNSITLELSDGSSERLDVTNAPALYVGAENVLYAMVKSGRFEARFSRSAQAGLAAVDYHDNPPGLQVGDTLYTIGNR
ncbi:MAG: hypothetical protein A2289_23470 [Deltaproteobacteria bacterium RIFOXYA12_FULL_58_15]|nr:MAG: hypothetical protein A2289_23470 [Deltaproteobacteria bacterium RIFOXYA12_FULL_58_15]